MRLKQMEPVDIPVVNLVLCESFTAARAAAGFQNPALPPLRQTFLRMYLARFPAGTLVAHAGGELVGFVFSHLWGQVGWLGPLAVKPQWQGQGKGRALVLAAVAALQKAGAKSIGLETKPHLVRNLGFYTRLGFSPEKLTTDLARRTERPPSPGLLDDCVVQRYSQLPVADRPQFLRHADRLAAQIEPHLRVGREIELVQQFGFGDALMLFRRGVPFGFALAHTEPYFDDEARNYLRVVCGLLTPGYNSRDIDTWCAALNRWAEETALGVVILRAQTRYVAAFREMLQRGFAVIHADVRMTLNGFAEQADAGAFYLSKWE